jgi:hypothetical protein
MKLTAKPLAVILFVVLFGSIAFTNTMGWWQTESQKVPAKFTEGEAAGEYNPADIRGSYTFQDIEAAFHIPVSDLAAAFSIPHSSDPKTFAVKELESIYAAQAAAGFEIGTASVRYFTALYNGLPYDLTQETYLPETAVDLLRLKMNIDAENLDYLRTHTVSLTAAAPSTAAAAESAQPVDETSDRTVKGKTTFQDLLNWGLSKESIISIIEADMPAGAVKVKDYCTTANLDFETIKITLQAEIDRIHP